MSKKFDYFSFKNCTYSMPKNKESTARITLFRQLRIPFVFTLECSFAGANTGKLAGQHFSIGDLMDVGRYTLKSIADIKKLTSNKQLLKNIQAEALQHQPSQQDDQNDSDGCSSSEEDESKTLNNKRDQTAEAKSREQISPEKQQIHNRLLT